MSSTNTDFTQIDSLWNGYEMGSSKDVLLKKEVDANGPKVVLQKKGPLAWLKVWWNKDQYKLDDNVQLLKTKIENIAKTCGEESEQGHSIATWSNKYTDFVTGVAERKFCKKWYNFFTTNEDIAARKKIFKDAHKLTLQWQDSARATETVAAKALPEPLPQFASSPARITSHVNDASPTAAVAEQRFPKTDSSPKGAASSSEPTQISESPLVADSPPQQQVETATPSLAGREVSLMASPSGESALTPRIGGAEREGIAAAPLASSLPPTIQPPDVPLTNVPSVSRDESVTIPSKASASTPTQALPQATVKRVMPKKPALPAVFGKLAKQTAAINRKNLVSLEQRKQAANKALNEIDTLLKNDFSNESIASSRAKTHSKLVTQWSSMSENTNAELQEKHEKRASDETEALIQHLSAGRSECEKKLAMLSQLLESFDPNAKNVGRTRQQQTITGVRPGNPPDITTIENEIRYLRAAIMTNIEIRDENMGLKNE